MQGIQYEIPERIVDENILYQELEKVASDRQFVNLQKALPYAKEKHEGQYRKGKQKVPYIYHPLMVARQMLATGIVEDDMLATALLHDVCEDCDVTPDELPVNENVQEAVRRLTKKAGIGEDIEENTLYYKAVSENKIATMVKLFDRCHNISSMSYGFSEAKVASYVMETQRFSFPLLEKAERDYGEYADALFVLRFQMLAVVGALKI